MTETTPLQDGTNTPATGNGTEKSAKPAGKSSRKPGYARERAYKALSNVDKDFKGKEESIGVIGVPSEGHLTYGVANPDEFFESLMNHAGSTFEGGADLKPLLEHEECPLATLETKEPEFPKEEEVTEKDDSGVDIKVRRVPAGKKYRYELEMKTFLARLNQCERNHAKCYEVIRGPCTPTLLQEVKGRSDYMLSTRSRILYGS